MGGPKHLGDVRRKLREDRGDGHPTAFRLAEKLCEGGREDEEGEEREQRQISEVAGVDEAVVVDADGHRLMHFQRIFVRLQLLRDVAPEGGAHARELLAAFLGG